MILGIIALLVGLAGAIVGVVALVKLSDMAGDLKLYKRAFDDKLETLGRKVDAIPRPPPTPKTDRPTSALPPDVREPPQPLPPSRGPMIRKKKPTGPVRPPTGPIPAPKPPPRQEAPPPPLPPPEPEPEPEVQPEPVPEPERVVVEPPAGEPLFINFDCVNCHQNIDAPEALAGTVIICPSCDETIAVPLKPGGPPRPVYRDAAVTSPVESEEGDTMEEAAIKGATVRIDIGKMFEEIEKPKRQIVIRRRQ